MHDFKLDDGFDIFSEESPFLKNPSVVSRWGNLYSHEERKDSTEDHLQFQQEYTVNMIIFAKLKGENQQNHEGYVANVQDNNQDCDFWRDTLSK